MQVRESLRRRLGGEGGALLPLELRQEGLECRRRLLLEAECSLGLSHLRGYQRLFLEGNEKEENL